jgi:hypothetical protein
MSAGGEDCSGLFFPDATDVKAALQRAMARRAGRQR